jgi:predicted XRE-type DNA-binding protein
MEAKENEAMAEEDVNVNIEKTIFERIREYKAENPAVTQREISIALSTSQSSVSRALKG